jgi:hypothetical protein
MTANATTSPATSQLLDSVEYPRVEPVGSVCGRKEHDSADELGLLDA